HNKCALAIFKRLVSTLRLGGVHLDTTIAEAPRSLSLRGTSGERAGEGLGRGAVSMELARLIGIPSPHSSVEGRGNRPAAWWWCQDARRLGIPEGACVWHRNYPAALASAALCA